MIKAVTIANCERPGCGKPLTVSVFIDEHGKYVCHRHGLTVVPTPPPTIQQRLAAFKKAVKGKQ
jgi:hypothetical protein